jgi:uncharacterized protein YkwD
MRRLLPSLVLPLLLAACGEQVQAPQPVAAPAAPDTATMGAAPALASCGIRALPEEVLRRVNDARARGQQCGGKRMPPAPALKWDSALFSAASGHSLDMAKRNYFDHRSPEGVDIAQRVSNSRYPWKSVGENLNGGSSSVDEAVQDWLASPQHCENLMDPRYIDMGVACVAQPGTQWGTYWTMVLARR